MKLKAFLKSAGPHNLPRAKISLWGLRAFISHAVGPTQVTQVTPSRTEVGDGELLIVDRRLLTLIEKPMTSRRSNQQSTIAMLTAPLVRAAPVWAAGLARDSSHP